MVLYGLAHFYVLISHDGSMIKRTVKCRYCRKWINRKVCRHHKPRQGLSGLTGARIISNRLSDVRIARAGRMEGRTLDSRSVKIAIRFIQHGFTPLSWVVNVHRLIPT